MKSLCVITIKLNTLTDVPYQIMVGGAFVYIRENLCKRSRLKILNNIRVCIYNAFFPVDPDDRVIVESQCSTHI